MINYSKKIKRCMNRYYIYVPSLYITLGSLQYSRPIAYSTSTSPNHACRILASQIDLEVLHGMTKHSRITSIDDCFLVKLTCTRRISLLKNKKNRKKEKKKRKKKKKKNTKKKKKRKKNLKRKSKERKN